MRSLGLHCQWWRGEIGNLSVRWKSNPIRRSSPETKNWGVNRTKAEVSLMLTMQRKCTVGSDVKGRMHFPSLASRLPHRGARVKLSKRQAKICNLENTNKMQLATYSNEIEQIVNTINSFSKEMMQTHRAEIKQFRAAKKERLMQLTASQIGTLIEHEGLTLVGEKRRTLKNGVPVVTLTLRGAQDKKAKILSEIAKLQKALETV